MWFVIPFLGIEQLTSEQMVKNFWPVFYCLRFTFRDERTGIRYADWKVISAAGFPMPFSDGVSIIGPPDFAAFGDTQSVLLGHAKALYFDGAIDYAASANG
jgi:hypothetical protein